MAVKLSEHEIEVGNSSTLRERHGKAESVRIVGFARYFKQYMGISSMITACLPIPVTAWGLIPTYSAQSRFLSVYTSLFCFLLLGFVFFSRHRLAGVFFRRKADGSFGNSRFMFVPPLLMISCLGLIFAYHVELESSISQLSAGHSSLTTVIALRSTDLRDIPSGTSLVLIYLGIFLSAEAAFILMATKEYLQDTIGIADADLFAAALAPHGWCTLSIYSDTNGAYAIVHVDGQFAGYIPWKVQLPPGDHNITVKKEGFKTWSKTVNISPNELSLDVGVELIAL